MEGRILVVEDNSALNKLICTVLQPRYNVLGARDVSAAMRILFSGRLPDLIVLDCYLPGTGGVELLDHLKSNGLFAHIPVVMVSGEDTPDFINKLILKGAVDYVRKPFNPQLLIQKVDEIIGHNQFNLSA